MIVPGVCRCRPFSSLAIILVRRSIRAIALITGHARKQDVPVLETHHIHIADVKTLPERVAALVKFNLRVETPSYRKGHFHKMLAYATQLHA